MFADKIISFYLHKVGANVQLFLKNNNANLVQIVYNWKVWLFNKNLKTELCQNTILLTKEKVRGVCMGKKKGVVIFNFWPYDQLIYNFVEFSFYL